MLFVFRIVQLARFASPASFYIYIFPCVCVSFAFLERNMSPTKAKTRKPKPEKKRHRTSVALKREICEKYDRGVRVRDLVQEYGLPKSTICTFLKRKEKLKTQDLAKGVVSLTSFKSFNS